MVEVGNFQNTRDRLRILDPNNRQAIANWMTNAFVEDYKRVTE
jgi:N-acetylmuramoyl-L-alanine amidase